MTQIKYIEICRYRWRHRKRYVHNPVTNRISKELRNTSWRRRVWRRQKTWLVRAGGGGTSNWTLFSIANQRGHMQNPFWVSSPQFHPAVGWEKKTPPLKNAIFMRKEKLKWWSRVHRAFCIGSDPAVRESASDQPNQPQRQEEKMECGETKVTSISAPRGTLQIAQPWQQCNLPGLHGVLWIKEVTSTTNLRRQLLNTRPCKSHHQVFPFPRILETS